MSRKIRIAVRLRPRISGELEDDSVIVCPASTDSGPCVSIANPRDPLQRFKFSFSSCYGQSSTQAEIFQNDVQPLTDLIFEGLTVTVFAYGVTSSGKTHTMQGCKTEPGIIPRVVNTLLQNKSKPGSRQASLSLSYMEIYKDEVYDLLVNRDTAPKLPVRENDAGQVFVANLTTVPFDTVETFESIYAKANKQRSTGATNLNHNSSRSHAVLTIEAAVVNVEENKVLRGKIHLVDLAGSENNKLTGNDPSRMAESSAINKSLSVLGQVVHALNQGASRIPYRNSKLTRILQDSLGGTSLGLLICNLAPGVKFRQDTLNTLNFATRTKEIENKPMVNERDIGPTFRIPSESLLPPIPQFPQTHRGLPAVAGPSQSRLQPGSGGISGPSRVPRLSAFGPSQAAFPVTSRRTTSEGTSMPPPPETTRVGLTDEELNERIAKVVEMEVAKRLEEMGREREREQERERARIKDDEERRAREQEVEQERRRHSDHAQISLAQQDLHILPSGVLTPLLRTQQEQDEELKDRLQELERKFERENKEAQLEGTLSPVSKKKAGRAYVALARTQTQKGNLQAALSYYRKAEQFVPDNVKLRERIIEIEWAVKNGKEFVPSPKKSKKGKPKGKTRGKEKRSSRGQAEEVESMDNSHGTSVSADEEVDMETRERAKVALGEATNSPKKRHADVGFGGIGTPPKKQRRMGTGEDGMGDEIHGAPARKGKTKFGIHSKLHSPRPRLSILR